MLTGQRLTGQRRVDFERRLFEERMVELEPGVRPVLPDGARIWIMDAAGVVSPRWQWWESVAWWDAAAWRAEDDLGNPVAALADDWDLDDDVDDDDDVDPDTGLAS